MPGSLSERTQKIRTGDKNTGMTSIQRQRLIQGLQANRSVIIVRPGIDMNRDFLLQHSQPEADVDFSKIFIHTHKPFTCKRCGCVVLVSNDRADSFTCPMPTCTVR